MDTLSYVFFSLNEIFICFGRFPYLGQPAEPFQFQKRKKQHVRIVETYTSPREKKLVGRNVRAVLHSFGGRRHLGGGKAVVVMNTECFSAAPKSFLLISVVKTNKPTASYLI